MQTISENLSAVRARIAEAAARAGRDPAEVRLVGVTKTHPAEVVAEAAAAGLADVGENRVQEAEAKVAALAGVSPQPRWHLIGHLQSNKARRAAQIFDCVHSVDSLRLAQALSRHAQELRPAPLEVLLQVNVSGEASKEGFDLAGWRERPEALERLLADAEQVLALPGLAVAGLMTVAPLEADMEATRAHFRSTRLLRDELAARLPGPFWRELSMGMTGDFPVAIEEGATMVRIGRAIFGARG